MTYESKLIDLLQVRARPVACAEKLKCVAVEKHIESIAQGLAYARDPLRYAIGHLWATEEPAEHLKSAIHKSVMCGMFFLVSALDAMVIADADVEDLTSTMSFFNTPLSIPEQLAIQEDIKDLESFQFESNTQSVGLQTVSNFYKHYMPVERLFKVFTVKNAATVKTVNICDMYVVFGEESGPIMHDIIIPAYNKACDLLVLMASNHNLHINVKKIS